MLVADLHHYVDLSDDIPGPARRLAEHLSSIVRAATAGVYWMSSLPCRHRPGNGSCPGRTIVLRPEPPAPIHWKCSTCDDEGVIPMALPELDVARVRRWCAARVPEHARHQVRVECEIAARQLTIVERRAPWREDYGPEWTSFPIARLRYTSATKSWTLFWRDRNLSFHAYDLLAPSQSVEDLLTELDRDPTCIFWG